MPQLDIHRWLMELSPLKQSELEETALCDRWGVFNLSALNGEVHTVPIYKNGKVRYGHVLGQLCKCKPTIEQYAYTAVIHNDVWG